MSASAELQTAIYDALVADVGVGALVGDRIYDGAPEKAAFPYITFGPTQQIMDDMDCVEGERHYIQLDAWDRSQGRKVNAKRISDAVKAALHDKSLSLADPYAVGEFLVEDIRVIIDKDRITAHGIISIMGMVEV